LIPSPRYSGERVRVRGRDAGDDPTSASPEGQPAPHPSSGLRPPSPRNTGEKDPEDRPHRGRLQIYDPDSLGQLLRYRRLFGDRCYLLVELHHGSDDERHLEHCLDISRRAGIPLAAAGGVLFHDPERRPLCDVLTATRVRQTVAAAAELLEPNAERYLKSPAQLGELFAAAPACLERTLEIAARCTFSLDELRYEYPEELAPSGRTPLEHLEQLTWQGARTRYPAGIPAKVQQLLKHELSIIADLRYEAYFLTVWDLVRFARQREILCQGRGSAANSAVCYCLGVTAVDPERMDVLFERFISRERNEAPDIDVDFEHERREEVLQYLYDKYGRERVGMTAEVITYRPRSAVRDVGKALGLSLDRIDALAKVIDSYHADKLADRCRQAGVDPESPLGRQLLMLVGQLLGFPRHLGQHVGGMVMTQGPLCELVPIENAAMADRTVIEWDKDDLDELGILKVDCLSLGMLTAIRKCFELVQRHHGRTLTLADVPEGDPATYEMISRADTMGVFQIESRAQMSMLPRLRPNCFYDLVVEVAIVRPGPIQGNMVHPYLRRRAGLEPITYPNDEIREVLHKTLGVPLFQEQAMRLAVVAAGFTPGEADQLRRAMGAWRRPGIIEQFKQKLTEGMLARGLAPEFAHHVFNQIRGFGEYGFPESHAASFALLAYVSAWLKCHYPAAFCAALLNSQPMGFYAPAQLVRNAREHGVEILPVDVNNSLWDATLENGALRLGLRQVVGLGEAAARQIEAARGISSVTEICNPDRPSSVAEANGLGSSSSSVAGLSEAGSAVVGVCDPDPSRLPIAEANGLSSSSSSVAGLSEAGSAVVGVCDPDPSRLPVAEASRLGQSPVGVEFTGGSPTSLTSATDEDRPQRGRLQKTDEDRPHRGQLQEDPSSGLRPPSPRNGEKDCAPFSSLEDFSRRTGLAQAAIARLARADAFGSLALDRRQSMWQALAHEKRAQEQPLLADLCDDEPLPPLPAMTSRDEVFADYQTIGLSLRAHPVSFFRPQLDKLRVVPAARLADLDHGRFVRVAGLVLVRQRPSTAKGITFVTLEDETGTTNLIVRMDVWERFHLPARTASAMLAMGRLQKQKD
ncbi:MAG: error-prone DNA polymerase, partial [Planctomycetaceae bacterium]|nr:error-prone DNA polymerase [Planctomycetaceae bacterium]